MNIHIAEDYEELSRFAAELIADQVKRKPDSLLCLAAGDTPRGTYSILAELRRERAIDFSRVRFVGLDEWAGLGPEDAGSCRHMLRETVFGPLDIPASRIHFFDAQAADLEEECGKINRFVAACGPLDFSFLGLGMNGHIGFNEPGSDPASAARVVALDETTRTVGQKYFGRQAKLEFGITLGLGQLLASRRMVIAASGAGKAGIVKQAAEGDMTGKVPGSLLRTHPSGVLALDRPAAAGLGGLG